jgi:2-polyprenyl-3-methyl-5-hydroxy-6-metoxy-1,4-benzoquinol methylase
MVVELEKLPTYDYNLSGQFSFLCLDDELIKKFTDRNDVALKIFFQPEIKGKKYVWGRPFPIKVDDGQRVEASLLSDSIIIQNICASFELAPRVFGVHHIQHDGNLYPVELVEYINEPQSNGDLVYENIEHLGKTFGFEIIYRDRGINPNILGGKLIDFQNFVFTVDKEELAKRIHRFYKNNATWSGNFYDDYRGDLRTILLHRSIDFKDKRVLDIGCNGGIFGRLAMMYGAKTYLGIDKKKQVVAARLMSYFLKHYKLDFQVEDLLQYTPSLEFDIVLFMSMNLHIGLPEYLFSYAEVVYEHNGSDDVEKVLERFKKNNYQIMDLGKTGTGDDRHTYYMKKL